MFDHNKKILIGDIDCTNFQENFKIRSLTRYRKLWDAAKKIGYKFDNFEEMESVFKEDIRVKRQVLKYLFFIENKLGAEIVYFILLEKDYISKFLDKNNKEISFIQINEKNPNSNINEINKSLNGARTNDDINLLTDELTFWKKINFAKVLEYYSKYSSNKKSFDLSFEIKDLRKFNTLRNKIVHHDFILLDKESLMITLNLLKKYISPEYKKKYNSFIKETEYFFNSIF